MAVVLLIRGASFAVEWIADAADEASLAGTTGTALSESWNVDGVDVVYVESGGTGCESVCWEWLLMTPPECATATVTVEIGDSAFGRTERTLEQPVTISGVTSVLVEAAAGDGEYADITAIRCP